jgi:hypothetical protein
MQFHIQRMVMESHICLRLLPLRIWRSRIMEMLCNISIVRPPIQCKTIDAFSIAIGLHLSWRKPRHWRASRPNDESDRKEDDGATARITCTLPMPFTRRSSAPKERRVHAVCYDFSDVQNRAMRKAAECGFYADGLSHILKATMHCGPHWCLSVFRIYWRTRINP